jgi:hypothetical protein
MNRLLFVFAFAIGSIGTMNSSMAQGVAELVVLGKAVLENRELIGDLFGEVTNGGTNLRSVVNKTPHEVILWKRDPHEEQSKIPANLTTDAGMGIPWADDAQEWKDHHMLIKANGRVLACLWQDRGVVRMNSEEKFIENGPVAPGISKGGGARVLYVVPIKKEDGSTAIGFAINGKK